VVRHRIEFPEPCGLGSTAVEDFDSSDHMCSVPSVVAAARCWSGRGFFSTGGWDSIVSHYKILQNTICDLEREKMKREITPRKN
jgi:hypothetical protein